MTESRRSSAADAFGEHRRLISISVVLGIVIGCATLIFFWGMAAAVEFFMNIVVGINLPSPGQSLESLSGWKAPESILLLLPVITSGGLASGYIIWRFCPEAEGAGTDAAIRSYHTEGRIRWRVPVVKGIASVLTIATGGSGGRLGPVGQISAGLGSVVADAFGLSEKERRIIIAAGFGAGIATIFKAPLGGAVLCGEILYLHDFESEVLIPAFISSIVSYSIFGYFVGYIPIFATAEMYWTYAQIPFFLGAGAVTGLMGLVYIWMYGSSRASFAAFFEAHNLPVYLKPAAGAFLVGLFVIGLSFFSPEMFLAGIASLGTGYGGLQMIMYNMIPFSVLLLIPFTKVITTSLTIGSGGSGGVFGPALVIGAATGGAFGTFLHLLVPVYVPSASIPVFAVVGMISLFGGISHAPVAVLIMIVEMTGNLSLFVPAMAAVAISSIITWDSSIFFAQVEDRARSPAHRGDYRIDILRDIGVAGAMVVGDDVITVTADMAAREVLEIIERTGHTGYPVVDEEKLVGIVTIGDLRGGETKDSKLLTVRDCMTAPVRTLSTADTLEDAVLLMTGKDIHHVPVVFSNEEDRIAGLLTTTDIMRAYAKALHSEIGD
ncbi:MAG TPA: CBS domain-containing protein [Methanoculleus sp.]|nr:CBS domain-containing protein [Methanoculleus sp.]